VNGKYGVISAASILQIKSKVYQGYAALYHPRSSP